MSQRHVLFSQLVDDGNHRQREKCQGNHSAPHGGGDSFHDIGADSGGDHDGKQSKDIHEHGQENRPQTFLRALDGRIPKILFGFKASIHSPLLP